MSAKLFELRTLLCFVVAFVFLTSWTLPLRAAEGKAAAKGDDKAVAAKVAQEFKQEKELEGQEKKILALQHFEAGNKYYDSGDYKQAANEFKVASDLDPGLSKSQSMMEKSERALKKAATEKLNGQVNDGIKLYRERNYVSALECFNKVLSEAPGNEKALEYKAKTEKAMSVLDAEGKAATKVGKEQAEKAEVLYEEGVNLYNTGNYKDAEVRFQAAVAANPVHIPARRYLGMINERNNEYSRRDEILSFEKAMFDVRQAWLPPSRTSAYADGKKKGVKKLEVKSEQQLLMEEKARQIVPEINFTEAHLRDVIKYLSKISGVNIILDEDLFVMQEAAAAAAAAPVYTPPAPTSTATGSATGISEDNIFEDEFRNQQGGQQGVQQAKAQQPAPQPRPAPVDDKSDRITISLTNIPLIEALKYILTTKGLKYRIDDYAILVSTPERLQDVEMETRFYRLTSGSGDFVTFEEGTRNASARAQEGMVSGALKPSTFLNIKDVLEQSGVPFPAGSKIFFDKKTGTLIVRNTPSNLAVIEDVLKTLDISPFQIAIQAKFVEISQTDAKELGLDWTMGTWNVNKMPNHSKHIEMTNNISGGTRFFNNNAEVTGTIPPVNATTAKDSLFSFVGTLTDPEFSVVLRALQQSGHANQLSAPKVMTVNNQMAQIRVVREFIYPTEYDSTPPTTNESGQVITPGTVTPKSFVTRNIGIILEVTPSAGSDRKTIHMTIVPEVSEFAQWQNYGTTDMPIIQPFFDTRTLSTSVVLNDGDTVVLGGLMKDVVADFNDKVPIMGDLPLFGRMFRSEGEHRTKTNLMVFVTADLISPSGAELRNLDIEVDEHSLN